MKIAVVGKWWSGKSTVSALLAKICAEKGHNVLAIDADYNMDMSYLLAKNHIESNTFNKWASDFYMFLWKDQTISSGELIEHLKTYQWFTLFPHDEFITRYIHKTAYDMIDLVVMGSHDEMMVYGTKCSHGYYKHLKYYLPVVNKKDEDIIVIDSVAGVDMVAYGLYLGVDILVIVEEPTPQSRHVSQQIQQIASYFDLPCLIIYNKVDQPANRSLTKDLWLLQDLDWLSQQNFYSISAIVDELLSYDKKSTYRHRFDKRRKKSQTLS